MSLLRVAPYHHVDLPAPEARSSVSIEEALTARRSVRRFGAGSLTIAEIGQLLWAAQGRIGLGGHRTAPSAGATYPLELYMAAGNVEDLLAGLYAYSVHHHDLALLRAGDLRQGIAAAAFHQDWIAMAAIVLIIAADYRRTEADYGSRGKRYVHIEAGHVGQNVYLQAVRLGLGTTEVGAFGDRAIKKALELPAAHDVVVLLPIGRLA